MLPSNFFGLYLMFLLFTRLCELRKKRGRGKEGEGKKEGKGDQREKGDDERETEEKRGGLKVEKGDG